MTVPAFKMSMATQMTLPVFWKRSKWQLFKLIFKLNLFAIWKYSAKHFKRKLQVENYLEVENSLNFNTSVPVKNSTCTVVSTEISAANKIVPRSKLPVSTCVQLENMDCRFIHRIFRVRIFQVEHFNDFQLKSIWKLSWGRWVDVENSSNFGNNACWDRCDQVSDDVQSTSPPLS